MDKTKIFEAAGKYAAKGQLDKAGREYQRILDEDPKDVRALQKLAEILQKSGKAKESTDLMLRVAEGYTEQGFFLKAVAVYKQILKVGPDRIEVNQKLAELYQQLGLIGDATQQYQLVANHFDKTGNTRESLNWLKKMVELDPDNVASRVKLGELYARENMSTEAVEELRRAAAYLKRNNRNEDYARVLERVGQIVPDDPAVARELAQQLLAAGDTRRALSRLQVCFKADPKDVETLQLLAQAFTALGQTAKTVSVYRELSSVQASKGQTEAERETLHRILEIAPRDEEAIARLRELSAPSRPPAVIAPAPPSKPAIAAPPPAPAAKPKPAAAAAPARPLDPGLSPAIAKILTETDVYLKYGLLPKATDHVRRALEEDPNCIPAHEKMLAILDKQGKAAEAIEELAQIVALARAAGDGDADSAFTQDLAARAPDHPLVTAAAAAADLPEVGEDIVLESGVGFGSSIPSLGALATSLGNRPRPTESLPNLMPLASEEAPAADAGWDASAEAGTQQVAIDAGAIDMEAGPPTVQGLPPIDVGDLPSIPEPAGMSLPPRPRPTPGPISRSREAYSVPPAMEAVDGSGPHESADPPLYTRSSGGILANAEAQGADLDALSEAGPPAEAPPVELGPYAEELAEAEFFIQQGLLDDARHIVLSVLERGPDDAEALSILHQIDTAQVDAAQVVPQAAVSRPPPAADLGDGGFDLGKELSAEFDQAAAPADIPAGPLKPVKDVFSELAEFKKAVSTQVSAEDSQTHYDLGIAYKEMGLYEEAIHEFEVARGAGGRRHVLDCLTMLGVCYLERGEPEKALAHFEEALKAPGLTLAASKEAHFEIAHCHELLGAEKDALDHYARVYKADPSFRDVRARLARLVQKQEGHSPGAVANGHAPTNGTAAPPARPAVPVQQGIESPPGPAARRSGHGKIGYI
jgi:tetratricopeptide (TPR) repeat protein